MSKNDGSDVPEILELVLNNVEANYWDTVITVDGNQIAGASDEQMLELRDGVTKRIEGDESDEIFSEIAELQRILKAKPFKRDKNGKVELHPQLQIPITEDFDIDENRPRNRILWAISDALKGKKPKSVKSITIKFGLIADLKKPKYSDAEFLAILVGRDTMKTRGLTEAWPVFREKFVPEDWEEGKESAEEGCLLTESKRIQKAIK